jgi:hypothetical protein
VFVSPVRYKLGSYIPKDGILHSDRRETLKFYIALTGWTVQRGRNVSPVRYELIFISQTTAFFIVTAVEASNLTAGSMFSETLVKLYGTVLLLTALRTSACWVRFQDRGAIVTIDNRFPQNRREVAIKVDKGKQTRLQRKRNCDNTTQ